MTDLEIKQPFVFKFSLLEIDSQLPSVLYNLSIIDQYSTFEKQFWFFSNELQTFFSQAIYVLEGKSISTAILNDMNKELLLQFDSRSSGFFWKISHRKRDTFDGYSFFEIEKKLKEEDLNFIAQQLKELILIT